MRKIVAGSIGPILLGIWLILTGLLPLLTFRFPGIVMNVLAIAAGAFILAGR